MIGASGPSWPSYLPLLAEGELRRRVELALASLERCRLCPRACGANRAGGELGECSTGRFAVVSSVQLHFGEEDPLVARGGSGTIFFSHCNLRCIFCQNHEISHGGLGRVLSAEMLAAAMLRLEKAGAVNINLVSPSHVVPQILEAVWIAARAGLRLPLVYNTGGYDSVATLRLLEGVVDIYMPDAKYADAAVAKRLSGVDQYPRINQRAMKEMYRQVGTLEVDPGGVARRGLIVRHLVLPEDLAGTQKVLRFVAEELTPDTYVNVMQQYHPCFRASQELALARPLRRDEYEQAVKTARALGLHNLAR